MGLTAPAALQQVIETALAEDVGRGDLTTDGLFEPGVACSAEILLKEPGVVAGIHAADAVFRALDSTVDVELATDDGELVDDPPAVLARLDGPVHALLTGERTALNLLGRLSGIATSARRYVDAVAGTGAVILDTRKTTPGLRALEKEAVRAGGGRNHRFGLDDAILVKDNHLRVAGSITTAIERLRAASALPIEIEVETLDGLREALAAGAEWILLDNMPPELLRQAVAITARRATLEASGGVTLDTVRAIAETGVDFISVGALTHSARSLDVSLEVT